LMPKIQFVVIKKKFKGKGKQLSSVSIIKNISK
jgi:hypothetical protein